MELTSMMKRIEEDEILVEREEEIGTFLKSLPET